ncbi:hypothetical protein CPL00187_CDS0226 [Escherichia phage GoldenSnicker]|nr:hypothetical protein W115_244 [Escherichia phage W115]
MSVKEVFVYTDYDGCAYLTAGKLYRCEIIHGTLGRIMCDPVTKLWKNNPSERETLINLDPDGCSHLDYRKWHIVTHDAYGIHLATKELTIEKFKFKEIPFVYWLRNLFKKGE